MVALAFSSAPDLRAFAEGRLMKPMGCGRQPCRCLELDRPRDSREADRGGRRDDPQAADYAPE